jgi:hypothetical protein
MFFLFWGLLMSGVVGIRDVSFYNFYIKYLLVYLVIWVLDDGRIMICWCVGVSACVWGNETIEKNFVEVIKVV